MPDVVNIGAADDDGQGDAARTAFNKINSKFAADDIILDALEASLPIEVNGLNALTLSNTTVLERSAPEVLIGVLNNLTTGSTRRMKDPNEHRVRVNGTRFETWVQMLEKGNHSFEIEELIESPTGTISRVSTVSIMCTQNNILAQPTPTLYVAPTARGTGDGSSVANAKALLSVIPPNTSPAVPIAPGTVIGVVADLGPYLIGSNAVPAFRVSGTSGSRIVLVGIDSAGRRKRPTFTSDPKRTPYPRTSHDSEQRIGVNATGSSANYAVGNTTFSIPEPIAYVDFEDLFFENVGSAFNVNGTAVVNNCRFRDLGFRNAQRFFEQAATTTAVTNCMFERITGFGFSKQGIRIRGASAFNTYNFVYLDSERQDGDNFSNGLAIDELAHDLTFNDCTFINFHCQFRDTNYWNSDGVSSEELNYNLFFNRCYFGGATDAGADLKSKNNVLTDCTFAFSKRLFKGWENSELIRPTFIRPIRRGGTGTACIFNTVSKVRTDPQASWPRLYLEDADLRLVQMNATDEATTAEFENLDAGLSALYDFVRVTEDAIPKYSSSANLRVRRSSSRPGSGDWAFTGSTTINIGADTVSLIKPQSNAPGGLYYNALSGPDAALFTIPEVYGDKIASAEIPYDSGGSNTYHVTATGVAIGGTEKNVALTVNVLDPITLVLQGLSAAGAPASSTEEALLTDFFDTLMSSPAEFSQIGRIFFIGGETETQALMDARNPSFSLSLHGGLTWVPNLGYKGNGSDGYLSDDRGWTYGGSKFDQNSGMVALWQNFDASPGSTGSHALLGGDGTTTAGNVIVNSNKAGQVEAVSIMSGGQTYVNPGADRKGFHGAVRGTSVGGTTGQWVRVFRDTTKVVDTQLAVQAPRYKPCILRNNLNYSADCVGILIIGGGNISDSYMSIIRTAMADYAAAKGW